MTNRFEQRFNQLKNTSSSALAEAGIRSDALAMLTMPERITIITTLIRERAKLSHADKLQDNRTGTRDLESRSLSPLLKLMRNPESAMHSIQVYLDERSNETKRLQSLKSDISAQTDEIANQRSNFTDALLQTSAQQARSLFYGTWQVKIVTIQNQADLIKDPAPRQISQAEGYVKVDKLSEIPQKELNEIKAGVLEEFEDKIEVERLAYAQQQIRKKHPKLAKWFDSSKDGALTVSEQQKDRKYSELSDQYAKHAKLSKQLSSEINTAILAEYNYRLANKAAELKSIKDAHGMDDPLILKTILTNIAVKDGYITTHNGKKRQILGILTQPDKYDDANFESVASKFFNFSKNAASTTSQEFLPLMNFISYNWPTEIYQSANHNSMPSNRHWLVTIDFANDGSIRLVNEGQLHSVKLSK